MIAVTRLFILSSYYKVITVHTKKTSESIIFPVLRDNLNNLALG